MKKKIATIKTKLPIKNNSSQKWNILHICHNSYKFQNYKLIVIYTINNKEDKAILVCLICLKYTDCESLLKIVSLLRAIY